MVLWVEQVLETRIELEPDVVVAVILIGDVDRDAGRVPARVQDLQTIGVVNARLGWPGPAPVRRWRGRGRRRAARACGQHHHEREAGQRRKAGTQPNRDSA